MIKSVGEVAVAGEATGRAAGVLLGAAGSTSTVDALVVAAAIELGGGVVLTGEPDDLEPPVGGQRISRSAISESRGARGGVFLLRSHR